MTHSFPTRRSSDLVLGVDVDLVLDFGDLGAHGAAADLDPVGAPRQQPIIVQPQQVGGELVGHLGRIVSRGDHVAAAGVRSEEHTSELQSLMRISYAVFCLKKKNKDDSYKLD